MSTANYGRYFTKPRDNIAQIGDGNARATVYDRVLEYTSGHLWAYQFGFWGGKPTSGSSNASVVMALYETNSNRQPTTRKGYSASTTVSAVMGDTPGGQAHTMNVSVADDLSTNTGIPLENGKRYGINIRTSQTLNVGQEFGVSGVDNETLYTDFSQSSTPPSSYDIDGTVQAGHMIAWVTGDINVAPDTPTNLAPSGSINTTTPTFSADFSDDNENRGDYLRQFRIQVREVGTTTLIWDATLTATSTERTNDAFSRAYAGSALSRGTSYEWRSSMSDHFGTWSDFSDWETFSPVNLGFITGETPTGKITDNTPDFVARWTHQSATSMATVQVRIKASDGTLLQTGADYNIADVASSADPGTQFTHEWANTGLSTLAWGQNLLWEMRGFDGTSWSEWSAPVAFNTNAAPGIPSGLSPTGSAVVTTEPLLTATVTDADDTLGSLTVKARIKDAAGAVIQTRTMTWDATLGKYKYQTIDPDDLDDGFATYRWDAYSYDGSLYSGEQTVEGSAVKSAEATFVYAEGPVVTITDPTVDEVHTAPSIAIAWTVDGGGPQTKYRIRLLDESEVELYSSDWVTSTDTSLSISTVDGWPIYNDTSYIVEVGVENDTALQGFETVAISVAYTALDALLNVQLTATRRGDDPWPTVLRLSWDATEIGVEEGWTAYKVERTAASGPDAGTPLTVTITSPLQIAFIDYDVVSGIEYTYALTQLAWVGLDLMESDPVEVAETVTLEGSVLHDVSNPDDVRVALVSVQSRSARPVVDQTEVPTWDGGPPWLFETGIDGTAVEVEARFIDQESTEAGTVTLDDMARYRDDDSPVIVCYRDERKRRIYGRVRDLETSDTRILRADVAFTVFATGEVG